MGKDEIGSSFEYKCGSVRAIGLLVRAWCSICMFFLLVPILFQRGSRYLLTCHRHHGLGGDGNDVSPGASTDKLSGDPHTEMSLMSAVAEVYWNVPRDVSLKIGPSKNRKCREPSQNRHLFIVIFRQHPGFEELAFPPVALYMVKPAEPCGIPNLVVVDVLL